MYGAYVQFQMLVAHALTRIAGQAENLGGIQTNNEGKYMNGVA